MNRGLLGLQRVWRVLVFGNDLKIQIYKVQFLQLAKRIKGMQWRNPRKFHIRENTQVRYQFFKP